jgi:hypothetical protein
MKNKPAQKKEKLIHPVNNKLIENKGPWMKRIMIGTPSTGLVRMEWVMSRFGQIIPTNWSSTDCIQWLSTVAPMQYLVPDAQNLIVKEALDHGFEWLLLIESDNVLPPDAFLRVNQYMLDGKVPVVSGLYFTKSVPPEPLLYRGRGNSYYKDWKMGDLVWVDGIPTGFTLIHCSILKEMWKESPEYMINGQKLRRVFETPEKIWKDPENGGYHMLTGTSDLAWCERVMKENFFTKAGWPEYQKMKYPFLVDTNIFVKHILPNGQQFPLVDPKQLGY